MTLLYTMNAECDDITAEALKGLYKHQMILPSLYCQ